MAAPTPAWNLVRCYATWKNLDGTKKPGAFRVSVPSRVTSQVDDTIIPKGKFLEGTLNTTDGVPSLDIMIPAVDDPDITPMGFSIEVTVQFTDGSDTETFYVKPSINGPAVNLRQVLLPSTPVPIDAYLMRGVPGGYAVLDRDGDVLNASGVKITSGGGTGGGGPITASQISDSSIVGRAVITAVDAAAVRAAIGAGISSLALGTTSTTAKAGNWFPSVVDIQTTGTRSSSTFLRGDGTWAVPTGLTDATASTKGAVQLAGDLGGTAAAPTVPKLADKQDASAVHTLAQMAPGAAVVIDYYKPVYGAANAWPATRPTNRTDLDFTWKGPTDPGNIALVGDDFKMVGP